MKTDDIYRSAKVLIDLHNDYAEKHASFMMEKLMLKNDAKGAAVWLNILAAIEDLRKLSKQKYIN
jgi:hypothetical protein